MNESIRESAVKTLIEAWNEGGASGWPGATVDAVIEHVAQQLEKVAATRQSSAMVAQMRATDSETMICASALRHQAEGLYEAVRLIRQSEEQ